MKTRYKAIIKGTNNTLCLLEFEIANFEEASEVTKSVKEAFRGAMHKQNGIENSLTIFEIKVDHSPKNREED